MSTVSAWVRPMMAVVAAVGGVAAVGPRAEAQLRADQVLVVYDSRIPDSLQVAEYYAGSAAVPGGVGGRPGTRPGVRAVNLAGITPTPPVLPPGDITYTQFVNGLRDPLRTWLAANDPEDHLRCLVLTKGLPHRIWEQNYPGEVPSQAGARFVNGIYCSASVDSELTLLWQNLGGLTEITAGTRSTGLIINPYYRQTRPVDSWPTVHRRTAKVFSTPLNNAGLGPGAFWTALVTDPLLAPAPTQLTPGDMYLVCRLDADTVADVFAKLDRAVSGVGPEGFGRGVPVDVDNVAVLLDESGSNGVIDVVSGGPELDNQDITLITGTLAIRGGDDYEQTRYLMAGIHPPSNLPPSDANPPGPELRYLASNIRYDAASGSTNFLVGPRVSYPGTVPSQIVSTPAILVSGYGSNHSGLPTGAAMTWATSFHLHPAAVFNSLESFNGRQFGGVPPPTPTQGQLMQQQAASFIAAGGTLAVANVWEPFSTATADNLPIARAFLHGHLSWGEAAYSSMVGLSWQQIVLGDPLTRLVRSREDFDADGRITVEDLYAWSRATPALRTDINRDGARNDLDRLILEGAVRASRDLDMRGRQR
jgi:hypothetical protein